MPDYSHLPPEKEAYFPLLVRSNYKVTSDPTAIYNCIAHAAEDSGRWWWPDDTAVGVFWPEGLPCEESIEAFIEAYQAVGYSVCDGDQLEVGFVKVAIYADADGVPMHAARQLLSGSWTSKLGQWEDIEHTTPRDLEDNGEGLGYGTVTVIMKRCSKME